MVTKPIFEQNLNLFVYEVVSRIASKIKGASVRHHESGGNDTYLLHLPESCTWKKFVAACEKAPTTYPWLGFITGKPEVLDDGQNMAVRFPVTYRSSLSDPNATKLYHVTLVASAVPFTMSVLLTVPLVRRKSRKVKDDNTNPS